MRRLISFKEFLKNGEPDMFFSGTENAVKEDVSGSAKKKKLQELEKLLKSHDWYFSYSDDGRAYRKGRDEQDKIRKLVDLIGKDGMLLHNQYAKKAGVMEGYQERKKVSIEKKIENVRERHSVNSPMFPEMQNVERNISLGVDVNENGYVLPNGGHHFADDPWDTTTKWEPPSEARKKRMNK